MSRKNPHSSLYQKELSNGVQIIALPMRNVSYVSFAFGIRVGSRHDPPNDHGIAHLLEHMMMTTTTSRPKTKLLYRDFDALGGSSNMYTSSDYTLLVINIIPEDVPLAAELAFDILKNAKWNSAQLASEKEVISSELKGNDDDPDHYNGNALANMLFEGSSLAHRAEGSIKSVTSITNRTLHAFKNVHYCGANLVVCVAGAISRSDVNRFVAPLFGQFESGSQSVVPEFVISQTEPCIKVQEKSLKQLSIALGFACEGMSAKEILTLDVVTSMLGDNAWSSLFFSKIRQQGLAYEIGISTEILRDVGFAAITGSTSHNSDKEVLRKILSIVKGIKRDVSPNALQFFKDYTCRQLALEATSAEFHASDICEEFIRSREILTPEEQIAIVQAVTRKEFIDITNKVFDFSRANLSLLGPCRSPNVYRRIIEEFL